MLKQTLINFTVAIVTIGIATTVAVKHDKLTALDELNAQHSRQLKKVQLITEKEFFEVFADTRILSKLPIVEKFLETGSMSSKQLVQSTFAEFANAYHRYDQIRIISTGGQELIRINYRDNHVKIVSDAALQDKSHRYYVQKGLKLKSGQVYVSPIDLNTEKGKIESDLEPMVRFVTPVTDKQHKVLGLLVINYQMNNLFDTVRTVFNMPHGSQYMLLNQDGYWLISPVKEQQWTWLTGHPEISFRHTHPDVWKQLKHKSEGILETDDGIYDWLSFSPLKISELSLPYEHLQNFRSVLVDSNQDDFLHLVIFTPRHVWQQQFWWHDPKNETLVVAMLVLVLIGSAIIARFQRYRYQLIQSQEETYNLYADLYQNAPFGYGTIAPNGTITDINATLLDWLGYTREELHNRPLLEFVTADCVDDARDCCEKLTESSIPSSKDLTFVCKNGKPFHAYVSASSQLNNNGDIKLIRLAIQDINQKFLLEQQLILLANTDPLTGVFNRRAWFERAKNEWARSQRQDTSLSVMMLDLDHFKSINDNYGHDFGDLVLKTFVQVCEQQIRQTDLLARFGGEEFCLLLPDTDLPNAFEVAKRLKQAIAEQKIVFNEQTSVSITVSIGISTRDKQTADLDTLIKQADNYLYHAKNQGRNQIKSHPL